MNQRIPIDCLIIDDITSDATEDMNDIETVLNLDRDFLAYFHTCSSRILSINS